MIDTDGKFWMVRAGRNSYMVDEFLNDGIVAIGWNDIGDLTELKSLENIKEKYRQLEPGAKKGKIDTNSNQIYKFLKEIGEGDRVITYDSTTRLYHIGKVISIYHFDRGRDSYFHYREVSWLETVERDILKVPTKNSLGSATTIFQISKEVENELYNTFIDENDISLEEREVQDEELDQIKDSIENSASEFIKDKLATLQWDEMQELFAGILRAMGYRTIVSPPGPDRGKDIIASPDGLGLQNPRIRVEVKHRDKTMGANEIRSFVGGLRSYDRGIYVSTGGFTKEAKYETERAEIPITLVDLDLLVILVINNYENFDPDTRALVPLKKIYWPV
ncbi:MAG: restriction endonuclease [Saprospiraceae bacterium]